MKLPRSLIPAQTRDGSPTLTYRRADGGEEQMHHRAGALSESLFIYGFALERARAGRDALQVLSLGLGLGYNEMITVRALDAEGGGQLTSFEADPFLRDAFVHWLNDSDRTDLSETYDAVAGHVGVEPERVREWWRRGRLHLRGAYPGSLAPTDCFNLVYFDAFSNKMDPELWTERALMEHLGPALAPTCTFASYAATGALNRALKNLGFKDLKRPRFHGHRNSTLAVRTSEGAG